MTRVPDSLLVFRSHLTSQIHGKCIQFKKKLTGFSLGAVQCFTSLLIVIFLGALPAQASFCKNIEQQQVCILSIDRSAKNFWEYQVQLTVNHVTQPLAVYNCQEQQWRTPTGDWTAFTDDSVNAVACSLFRP
jgi:hypothetical protein